jgi:hypothetical protein
VVLVMVVMMMVVMVVVAMMVVLLLRLLLLLLSASVFHLLRIPVVLTVAEAWLCGRATAGNDGRTTVRQR